MNDKSVNDDGSRLFADAAMRGTRMSARLRELCEADAGFPDSKHKHKHETDKHQHEMNTKTFNELGGALHRIAELNARKVVTSDDSSEKRALEAYVAGALRENAEQLLAAWVTVENEYKPLVSGFASLFSYATQIMAARRQPPGASESTEPNIPENVAQLHPPKDS
jgi:hypothetical protein